MSAVLKLFRSAEKKKNGNSSPQAAVREIGMPTQVSHNFSGKVNPDGTIDGIPESWKQRLKLMITNEEAITPQNAEKAAQIFKWIETRDATSEEFMRVNSESPPGSAVSSETSSGASFVSYIAEMEEHEKQKLEGPEHSTVNGDVATANGGTMPAPVPAPRAPAQAPSSPLDNSVVNAPHQAVCDNELPTLRRKKKDHHTTRQGPRVTRNLSEEQIISELQDCCQICSPWEVYRKVSALFIWILCPLDNDNVSHSLIILMIMICLGYGTGLGCCWHSSPRNPQGHGRESSRQRH